jgi:hypothetical protein
MLIIRELFEFDLYTLKIKGLISSEQHDFLVRFHESSLDDRLNLIIEPH